MIRSSQSVRAASANYYDDTFDYYHGRQKFFGRIKYEDDPDNLQFQLHEVHPYDLSEDYAWATKDSPANIRIIQHGKTIDNVSVPDYIEDDWDDPNDYVNDVIDRAAVALLQVNRDVEPQIDHT